MKLLHDFYLILIAFSCIDTMKPGDMNIVLGTASFNRGAIF